MHRSPMRPSRPCRGVLSLVAVAVLAVLLSACGDSGSSSTAKDTSPSTTVAAKPGVATVAKLTVPPSVDCGAQTSTTFTFSYETADAKSVELYVDGAQQSGDHPTSGSATVPVRCDGLPHDVVVRAIDADGNATVSKTQLTTQTANS